MVERSRTLVKICGVRTPAQALVAAEAGADLIGLVFYPPSPRNVALEDAAAIVRALRVAGSDLGAAGLFVNEDPARINAVREEVGLDLVQLSGDEQPAALARIDAPILRAIRVESGDSVVRACERLAGYAAMTRRRGRPPGPLGQAFTPLLDAHVPGRYGGTGARADWTRAATLARLWPLFLAGGLTRNNVAEAIRAVRPFGVDVSSGVETDGVKDADKIRRFVRAVRTVDEVLALSGDEVAADAAYRCRVCGLTQPELPWGVTGMSASDNICPCCGTQFGYQDIKPDNVKKSREWWIANGAQWFRPEAKPEGWDLDEQLRHIPLAYR